MESGQQLRIGPLLANTAGSNYHGVDSIQAYTFTGGAASVELVQPASSTAVAYAMFTVGADSSNYYRLFVSGTTLTAQQRIAGGKTDVTLPYDASLHRFLRMRHATGSGLVVWETAPGAGGVPDTWTVRRQATWDVGAVPLSLVRFELKAGTSDAQPAPGTVVFDNFQAVVGGTQTETVLLAEDFSAASLNTSTWAIAVQSGAQDASIPVVQSGGALSIGPLLTGAAGSHYNGILSVSTVDLTGARASVEAVTAPSASTTADLMFTVTADAQHHYRVYVEQGRLKFERKTLAYGKEAAGGVLTFDPTTHAYWRIRHEPLSDEVVVDTAPRVSGVPGTWVERGRSPRAFALGTVKVELEAGTWQAETSTSGTVRFDSVQVVR